MKKNKLGIIIMTIGVMIVLYPIVSNIIASYTQTTVISSYKETVKRLEQEQIELEKQKAREYNEKLSENNDVSIQIGEDDDGKSNESQGVSYINVLGVGQAVGYISIPKINTYLPIYHGTSEAVLQSGVGHVQNSSFPIGENNTHAVLAGHTGLVRTKIFDDIDKLQKGDKFYIHILNEKYAYQVDQIKTVNPEDTEYVQIEEGKEYVTLLTCTPYGINSHRLLVRGSRVELDSEIENQIEVIEDKKSIENNRQELYKQIVFAIIIFLGLIILIIVVIIGTDIIYKKKKGKH